MTFQDLRLPSDDLGLNQLGHLSKVPLLDGFLILECECEQRFDFSFFPNSDLSYKILTVKLYTHHI